MFWDKKENKSTLPDLPPVKQTMPQAQPQAMIPKKPAMEEEDEEEEDFDQKHNLPSFPDSPMKKGFSQAAIKDAITNEEEEETTIPEPPMDRKFKTMEADEAPVEKTRPVIEQSEETEVIKPMPQAPMPRPRAQQGQKNVDIFVKIDKFYSAKRSLNEAKAKLEEIDDLLRKIRETKMREEQELSAWEKEIASVKTNINEITATIFEKLD